MRFEKRFSKQDSVIRLKSNILAPLKFMGWLRHWISYFLNAKFCRPTWLLRRTVARKSSIGGLDVCARVAWHWNLTIIPLIYVSYFNLEGLDLYLEGLSPQKTPPVATVLLLRLSSFVRRIWGNGCHAKRRGLCTQTYRLNVAAMNRCKKHRFTKKMIKKIFCMSVNYALVCWQLRHFGL